jgi:DNA-binding CsgD family transcriptional regulator
MADELGNLRIATQCMDMRARHAMETGDLEAAYRLKREAYDRVRPVDPAWARTFENGIVGSLSLLGRHREALAFGLAAMHRYPDPSMPWLEEWRTQGTGWSYLALEVAGALFALGQWQDAQRLLDAARKLVREGDLVVSLSAQAAILAARRGSFEEAAALTAEASEHRRRANMPSAGTAELLRDWLTADAAAVRGDVIAMRRAASRIWEDPRIEEGSAGFWDILLNAVRAEVAALGDPYLEDVDRDAATAHLAILRRVAGRLHRSGDVDNASWKEVQSLFARAEAGDTIDTWHNAVEDWARIGQVYDEAICRTRYAESLLVAGDRIGGRTQLLAAMQTAERLGAQPLMADVRRVAGRAHLEIQPHPRSPESDAAHSLTAREREVLELIAFGRTNEQIAHQLYISPKTASVHVSRILTKLGATNRTEAARIARDEALLER